MFICQMGDSSPLMSAGLICGISARMEDRQPTTHSLSKQVTTSSFAHHSSTSQRSRQLTAYFLLSNARLLNE